MPELPEVETIRRELQAVLPGRRILAVAVRLPKIVHVAKNTFRRRLIGARVVEIRRRAKLLLFNLNNDWTVIVHLKMSGQLIWVPDHGRLRVGGHPIPHGLEHLPNKYSHVMLTLTGGTLYFNDQRQFGFVKLLPTSAVPDWLEGQGYGPEPLEHSFTFQRFNDLLLRHRRKRLKPTLLDQTVIAGVGNIYADEACFAAGVRPARRIQTMTLAERKDLYVGLRRIMMLAIKRKGTTANSYRTTSGEKGSMLSLLKVYGRDGLACRRCRGTITKTVLAGRGTHYCPLCQH